MRKLNRPTDERIAVIKGLATSLLWYGKVETTLAKAKELKSYAEKLLTLAINSYDDNVKVVKTVTDEKGVKVQKEVINDGVKKLNARRAIMSKVYDIQEQMGANETKADFVARTKKINHPLIEKIFNELAPKYATRTADLGIGGGYTRVIKVGPRRGDAAEISILELV